MSTTAPPTRDPLPVAVIGAGSYGTCLAILLAGAGHRTTLWARGDDLARELETTRENQLYLPGFKLPDGLAVTSDLETAVQGKAIVVGVTPSHAIRDVLGRAATWLDPDVVLVNASKGLEERTLETIGPFAAGTVLETQTEARLIRAKEAARRQRLGVPPQLRERGL